MDDERPRTDWEARVTRAKREGTWYAPNEEPSPYPPRERRKRFWSGFGVTLVFGLLVHTVLGLITGRGGPPLSLGNVEDGLLGSVFIAVMVGWAATRPPRPKQ